MSSGLIIFPLVHLKSLILHLKVKCQVILEIFLFHKSTWNLLLYFKNSNFWSLDFGTKIKLFVKMRLFSIFISSNVAVVVLLLRNCMIHFSWLWPLSLTSVRPIMIKKKTRRAATQRDDDGHNTLPVFYSDNQGPKIYCRYSKLQFFTDIQKFR